MPQPPSAPTAAPASPRPPRSRNATYGLVLFFVYLVIYGGYVVLSAFVPSFMAREAFAGLNWAVVYGLSLILIAFVLALVYAVVARVEAHLEPGNEAGVTR